MKKSLSLVIILFLIYNNVLSQDNSEYTAKYYQQPIVKMTLNGKKTWVLLDTGAGVTILNSESKREFNFNTLLKTGDQYLVPGFGSEKNQLQQVSQAKLEFGNTHLKQVMYAFDISNIAESIYGRTGKRITAILGTKMMKQYGFMIDLGSGIVTMSGKKKKRRSLEKTGMLITSI